MKPIFDRCNICLYEGDCVKLIKYLLDESVNCIVTSPPYWGLRDYGIDEQIGLEDDVNEYIEKLVVLFRECKRVLKNDGTIWVNMGDAYSGSGKGGHQEKLKSKNWSPTYGSHKGVVPLGLKPKDLIGLPWRLAFALQADGWYLRNDIIWHKPNPMPESCKDRLTKAHEYIFLLSKSKKYYFDYEAILEDCVNIENRPDELIEAAAPHNIHLRKQDVLDKATSTGFNDRYEPRTKRNKRDVWTISTEPYKEAHFATFPQKLIEPCILAGCPIDGVVLDPFCGSGTTGVVAARYARKFIGIELNPSYIHMQIKRIEVELDKNILFL